MNKQRALRAGQTLLLAAVACWAVGCGEQGKPYRKADSGLVGAGGDDAAAGAGGGGAGGGDAAGGTGGAEIDAARDLAPFDTAVDVAVDAAPVDAAPVDVARDSAPVDSAPVDVARRDVAPDAPIDAAVPRDATADAPVDTAAPDVAVDVSADLAPDSAPDLAVDVTPDTAPAIMAIAPCQTAGDYLTTPTTITFRVGVNGYTPACLKVPRHTQVTFSGAFGTHPLEPRAGGTAGNPITNTSSGSTTSFTFDDAGFFPYHCGIHSDMIGVVWVSD